MKKLLIKYHSLKVQQRAMLWYTFANILIKSIALLSTPIFTRLMTTGEYGTFTIFQSWLNILIIISSLNMFQGGYTKGILKYKDDVDGYTSSSLALTMLITIGWSIVYVFFTKQLNAFFGLSSVLMIIMFFNLLVMPAFEFWAAKLRFEYKYREFVFASIIISFSSVLLGIILVVLCKSKVEARALADLIARLVICGWIIFNIYSRGKCLYEKQYWMFNLKFNIPLIPHFLAFYILNQSDRIMISKMVGNTQAAYYSVAYTISMMMNLIINALNNALTPYIYISINDKKEKEIQSSTAPLYFLITLLCIITMVFAPEIITIFAGHRYADAVYVVPPIAASVYFIFVYSMFSTIEYYYQKTAKIALATSISAILNLVLNVYFIKIFGYYAAGYTTLFSYMMLAMIHYIFYRAIVNSKLGKNVSIFNMKIIIGCSVLVLAVMVFMLSVYKYILIRYSIIVICIIGIAFNYDKLKKMIALFKTNR